MSIVDPAVPAGAFDDFLRAGRPGQRDRTPDDDPFPAFHVSHGAPPVFDDPLWIRQLSDWALSLPRPRALLVVSAHWESERAVLSPPPAGTPLVYDFGGFHRRCFEMRYATPDATALARQVAALMPADEPLHAAGRGLDHGARVPLTVVHPDADVPVLQLSTPTHDPDRLPALGRRLRPLREQGVLVVGSGFMTHGLQFATREMFLYNEVPTWSREFDTWVAEALARGDVDALADHRRAPGTPHAHPTVEHHTPLSITLGAATDPTAPPTTVIDDFQTGFAERSLQVA